MAEDMNSDLYTAVLAAGDDIDPIAKEYNQQLRYSVRGWDAILNRIAPILRNHGLLLVVNDENVGHYVIEGLPKE